MSEVTPNYSVIIGLGNPGPTYYKTRHNIGFRVVDALCEKYGGVWKQKENYLFSEILIQDKKFLLLKPQTGMNLSGAVVPKLKKMGYELSDILAVYDEMEKPFGAVQLRLGGSHRGHNGVRSLMEHGDGFWRLRFGIGRPAQKSDVAEYVLAPFTQDEEAIMDEKIVESIAAIEKTIQ